MLLIPCPWCGDREEVEFHCAGEPVTRPDPEQADDAAWAEYLYMRDNPKGVTRELWHHLHGCRRWLVVERDTVTHAILAVRDAATRTENDNGL